MPTPPSAVEQGPVTEPNLAAALHALDGAGLPWLLLRGEDDLARPSGDVDLLVARQLLPRLDGLLASAGFCRVHAPGHGTHRFYFCYSAGEDFWVKLDVVSDIAFGPHQQLKTPWASGCLARRVHQGPVWLPAPADQAWLQLLHLVLDKGQISPQKIDAARKAAEVASPGDAVAGLIDRRIGPGTAAHVLDLVLSGGFDGVQAMAARMKSAWAGGSAVPRLIAARNTGLRLLGARLRGRGPVLGVMGPDGAGKTTLLHGLQAAIPLPTKYVYMGMWGAGPWDARFERIPGWRTAKKVLRLIRGGLVARAYSLLGRLVLMDRVAYDALLPGSGDGGAVHKATNSLAFTVVQDPDILLVLDAPGDVMFGRKGEHSAAILEGWRRAYRTLADRLPGSSLIDAAQPQELVRRQATGIVWRRLTPGAGAAAEAPAAALSLHLWRLLDWRFLLPDLLPRTVGYGGAVGPERESALRLLDPEAGVIRPGHDGEQGKGYEVVLLAVPDLALFRSAAAALEPGGWMCVEVRRSLLRRSGPRTLKGWKRALIRAGFQDVGVYWNAPTLDRTARIVPVASAAAIGHTLALHRDVRFGASKAFAARLAFTLHLFDLAIPEGSVLGRRPLDGRPLDGRPLDGRPLDGRPLDGRPLDGRPLDGRPLDEEPL
ncbi:hypothetical protein [Arthrobacter sp. CJ23]|uniref:hypothetical protein n=1 Tax=Arthrobacter sp. CJ23 TaxID=2972479 RepID=UPI00215C0E71|nr:hypothetical protein [Arthrobacter sp. CJ23]UVJ39572.1 hypothetical protein NVV90_20645 [Arthrobacter sp. CJ23]